MKKFAKLLDKETGLVSVSIAADPDMPYFTEHGYAYHEVEQAYNGNWYLVGYAPEQPLEEAKAQKLSQVNSWRNEARQTEGAEYALDLFDIDEVSQSNIMAQIKVAELLGNPEVQYIYRSKSNKDHMLNLAQLQELGLAIASKVNQIYQHSWNLKAAIQNAKTLEEVQALSWDSTLTKPESLADSSVINSILGD